MNLKKLKWPFYIFTFLLITVVATILQGLKNKTIPQVSEAILLVVLFCAIVYGVFRVVSVVIDKKGDKSKRKQVEEMEQYKHIMHCTNCGIKLDYTNKYCNSCGTKVKSNKSKEKLRKIYKITGSVSILMGILGVVSGMIVNFSKEKILTDLIGAIIYNFPRLYFGYTIQNRGLKDINYGLRVSIGMTIYSTLIVILNLVTSLTGLLYIIPAFFYFKSYKMTKELK